MNLPTRAPLQVAHVALQLETGGLERLLVEFVRCADRASVSPRVICMGERGPVADDLERLGCPVTALGLAPGLRPRALFELTSLFRSECIDVVHTHNTKPLLYAGPAARMAGVPAVVHTRHGQRHGASRRQNFLFRLAARCAHRIVCVSEDSRRCSEREGLGGRRLVTIPNGICLDRFCSERVALDGPALFVGRLTAEKDVATLLQAATRVGREMPGFRLRIVGDGPCASELRELAWSLGLSSVVAFLGPRSDVAELLRTSSMLVLPSRTEGIALTVLEAMASGLPVVATRVGGTPEAVEDGVTGRLVAVGDADGLAAAMSEMLGHPDRAHRMGIAGQVRARERFDVRAMVAAYEALYRSCIAEVGALAA